MQGRVIIAQLLLLPALLVACRDQPVAVPSPSGIAEPPASEATIAFENPPAPPVATLVPTEIPPTPTPSEPMAALVNDEPIFLATYEKELARYERAQAELGASGVSEPSTGYQAIVLDALIERLLITQAAETLGLAVTPQMVDGKLAELQTAAGDAGNFAAWLEANLWTEEEFREALAAEMLTEQLVSQVTANVPAAVEQVRARYLQVDDLGLAQTLLQQIRNGDEFTALARQYSLDQVTGFNGGDLGFFSRGSLLVPSVEEAAFSLEPGGVSEVLTETSADGSRTTYYLVQLVERDPMRPLSADMRYSLLQHTFETWLQEQREQAVIIRLVNTDA